MLSYGYNLYDSMRTGSIDTHDSQDRRRIRELYDQFDSDSTQESSTNCLFCSSDDLVVDVDSQCMVCSSCGALNGRVLSHKYRPVLYSSTTGGRCNTVIDKYCPKSSLRTRLVGNGRKYAKHDPYIPHKEKRLQQGFKTIKDVCHMNFPQSVIDKAKDIYFICSIKISKGELGKAIKAACVHLACKQCKIARTENEVCEMFNVKKTAFTKALNKITLTLSETNNSDKFDSRGKHVKPCDFVGRFCTKLGLIGDTKFQSKVNKIIEVAEENGLLDDVQPQSVVAGTILYVAKQQKKGKNTHVTGMLDVGITKKKIHETTKTSEATIAKFYRILSDNEDIFI